MSKLRFLLADCYRVTSAARLRALADDRLGHIQLRCLRRRDPAECRQRRRRTRVVRQMETAALSRVSDNGSNAGDRSGTGDC